MAKKRKKRRSKKNAVPVKNILGLVYVLVAALGYFARGFLGILLANMTRFLIGDLNKVAFVLLAIYGIYLLFTGKDYNFKGMSTVIWGSTSVFVGALLWFEYSFALSISVNNNFINATSKAIQRGFTEQTANNPVGSGMIGAAFYQLIHFCFSTIGSLVITWLFVIVGIVMIFGIPFDKILESVLVVGQRIFSWIKAGLIKFTTRLNRLWQSHQANKQRAQMKSSEDSKRVQVKNESNPVPVEPKPIPKEPIIVDGTSGVEHKIEPSIKVASEHVDPKKDVKTESDSEITSGYASEESTINPNYKLPPSSLLTKMGKVDQSSEYDTIKKNTKILQETLTSFGVDATVESVSLGPSVTEYELHPAIGVKVSKIVGLTDDLALALAAKDIRIEAPIPGKSLIGIEVPNNSISPVSFRDIIESQPEHHDHILQVPIGRDVSGNLVTADLVKMQHLLIAGATGSGKSVMINVIINGLLMNARPDEVKFILIDPKKVELGIYNDIPHLLTPVVTDAKKASRALHKVVAEMQHRYDLFAEMNQRNIKGYNEYIDDLNKNDGKQRPHLPYIVVIVDELSDLMMVASNEVEDAIIRLAQLARAAGIHMIIATQRPSVDVVTGLIKANVPSRIAFAVASGIDSRTIIDSNGAEKLLGRGDMLYFPMGQNKPERVQGAFISDEDVKKVIEFVKTQQDADYDEDLVVTDEETNSSDQQDDLDEHYDEAVELVTDMQKASTSMLQRKFRIGYNRAARLIDQLEQNGIIGPQDGSKPRVVYRQKDDQK
ncbi:DNA translocase FtsK [Pediococcus argentinicus]|uniref:DNA translocase FtsK n=1 Tax=Pediococcus argentinicus TaxID=480391 RepID=UPI00338F5D69